MKILEIINLPNSAINFIGGQFRYFTEEGGHEMHLICTPGGGIEKFCEENGVHYYPVQLARQMSALNDFKALMQICKYIRKNKIEMVIAHQSKGRLLGMIACALTGVKYRITFAHGVVYETMHGLKRKLMILNDKFVSMLATKVVCVSQYVVDFRKRDGIDKAGKTVMLGKGSCNGLDTINKFNPEKVDPAVLRTMKSKYDITNEEFILGFCGRLVRDKGIIELIAAFNLLLQRNPDKKMRLLIIGEPEIRDGLPTETISTLKTSKDIIFTGPVPFAEIQNYYLLMNALILPTHREGFGMVSVEAEAMGIPAIVSDYTGCAETIIDGVTGLYINKQIDSIIHAVETLFDKEIASKMGAEGRRFVTENFEHTVVRKHLLDLINSIVVK